MKQTHDTVSKMKWKRENMIPVALWRGLWTMLRKTTRGSVSPAHLCNSPKGTNLKLKPTTPSQTELEKRRKSANPENSINFWGELGFERVPNTEIGSAIVDDDGSGGTEEMVIGLALNFGDERHCVGEEEEVVLVISFVLLQMVKMLSSNRHGEPRPGKDPRTSLCWSRCPRNGSWKFNLFVSEFWF